MAMKLNLEHLDLFETHELPKSLYPLLSVGDQTNLLRFCCHESEENQMSEYAHLIKKSFDRMYPISNTAPFLFFENLFLYDPYLSSHFTCNAREQCQKFYDVLSFVVHNMGQNEVLIDGVKKMIQQHWLFDVTNQDFEAIGDAWLMTLHQLLGKDFSNETREAWIFYIELLSSEISVP